MDFALVALARRTRCAPIRSSPCSSRWRSGFAVGPWKVGGFTLGNVTATLLAGVLIGQLGITVGGPIKSAFFLLFLFAVGYGVGPQFFRGLGKEGPRQIVFSLVVLALCLVVPVLCAMAAGLDVGYAAGLYAGSQTISAAIGVATDQIDRLGYPPEQAKALRRRRPDRLRRHLHLRHDRLGDRAGAARPEADRRRPARPRAPSTSGSWAAGSAGLDAGVFSAYRAIELRAYRIDAGSRPDRPAGARAVPGAARLHRARSARRRADRCRRRHRALSPATSSPSPDRARCWSSEIEALRA